ncbi:hypothetical protein RY280_23470 [Bacillus paralicheniformis]|uniref:hypothetical protein n=1 Tax=Bacillus paralicheniformis TaxID=1648923 RepID=UPI00203E1401|nr:hypothetical protein [Bacillus paralicheniformis]MCM3425600.1 hypothetical protein [Bacillus paralicheniformis]
MATNLVSKELLDSIENPIIKEFFQTTVRQQEKGIKKYGVEVKTDSYDLRGWVNHALEETVDKGVYLVSVLLLFDDMEQKLNEMYNQAIRDKELAMRLNDLYEADIFRERASAIYQCGRIFGFDLRDKQEVERALLRKSDK